MPALKFVLAALLVAAAPPEAGALTGSVGLQAITFQSDKEATERTRSYGIVMPDGDVSVGPASLSYEAYFRAPISGGGDGHADIRELLLGFDAWGGRIAIGVRKVFWGVTESRHLVDVVNQRDALVDVFGDEKLGQPLISYERNLGSAKGQFLWMPAFRERNIEGDAGRIGMTRRVQEAEVKSEFPDGRRAIDNFAFRLSGFSGDIDYGVYFFHGISREPWVSGDAPKAGFRASYPVIDQIGIDLQMTAGAALWKFEGIANRNRFENFRAAVLGVEYSLYDLFPGPAEVGLLAEYLYSDRRGRYPDLFQDDVFVGVRLALNDVGDTSVLIGSTVDRKSGARVSKLEFETRLGEDVTVNVEGGEFSSRKDALAAWTHDDYLRLTVRKHF